MDLRSAASSSTAALSANRITRKLGIGTSLDGINWSRSATRVISERAAGGEAFWFSELAELDGEPLLFVEVAVGQETSVLLARASTEAILTSLEP